MVDSKNLELIKQSLKIVFSEIVNSKAKKLYLSYLKQDIKSTFSNIYDSMDVEMHNIDSRLMISLAILIKELLLILQDHLEDGQYEDLKEVLDLWYVPRKFG
ncbi:hypothetical protein LCGC14_1515920 [marine sediment metagenome]|uniref:Uncharacterized protein n=1 Tax=marine sediment metagenome TaxID=412755 RepID=A0A0F9J053_9ZZZZ